MEPFTITNTITKSEYSNLILKISYKRPMMLIISVVGLMMLVAAISNTLGYIKMQDTSNPPIFQYAFGCFALILPFITKFQAAKMYDNSPQLHHTITYSFTDKEIISAGKDVSAINSWDSIIKHEYVGKYLLLYVGHNVAQILNTKKIHYDQLEFIKSKLEKK